MLATRERVDLTSIEGFEELDHELEASYGNAFAAQERRQERLITDEQRRNILTDASERLALPMENTFFYRLGSHGLESDTGEQLRPVFESGLRAARQEAAHNPDWQFEAERREIELAQLGTIEAFAHEHGGVSITSFSLDRSDQEGMRAIATRFGYTLPEGKLRSEDMLRRHFVSTEPRGLIFLSPVPDAVEQGVNIGAYDKTRRKMLVRVVAPPEASAHAELVDIVRTTYDQLLQKREGGMWFAGRPAISEQTALEFIQSQPDLIDAHVRRVEKALRAGASRHELDALQYDFIAALDARMEGGQVAASAEGLGGAGNAARDAGKEFEGDCPTGSSVKGEMGLLGFSAGKEGEKKLCTCPYCKQKVMIDPCAARIQCPECYAEVRNGQIISRGRGARKLGRQASRQSVGARPVWMLTPKK